MQEVERTERVLRSFWRERNQHNRTWPVEYRALATQSSDIRRTGFTLLENLLK